MSPFSKEGKTNDDTTEASALGGHSEPSKRVNSSVHAHSLNTGPQLPLRVPPVPIDAASRAESHPQPCANPTISPNTAHKSSPAVKLAVQPRKGQLLSSEQGESGRRRFAPQLVETTSRRRKSTDSYPCMQQKDKTDFSPETHGDNPMYGSSAVISDTSTNLSPNASGHISPHTESRFSSEAIGRRKARQHSFHVPELPSIQSTTEESDHSGRSGVPSLSTSPSAASDGTEAEKTDMASTHGVQTPEQKAHMVSFAAHTAEKQLRDQVIAAYPNEHDTERIHHFAAESSLDDSEDERKGFVGRGSHSEFRRISKRVHSTKLKSKGSEASKSCSKLGQRRQPTVDCATHTQGRIQTDAAARQRDAKDQEMNVMRKAASPPMAGQDLRFRRCRSPRGTRLDCSNYPHTPRELSQSPQSSERAGLWEGRAVSSRQTSGVGLWHGFCSQDHNEGEPNTTSLRSGILTPAAMERQDPMSTTTPIPSSQLLPPTPPSSHSTTCSASLTPVLFTEEMIDREFPDEFVTILYDYCSFGYPSMARRYDEELSKITNIPVAKIRQDDNDKNPRGHIGVHHGTLEGFVDGTESMTSSEEAPGHDERWKALKIYVREWAQQSPHMLGQIGRSEWGNSTRKGSWAI